MDQHHNGYMSKWLKDPAIDIKFITQSETNNNITFTIWYMKKVTTQ